MTINLEKPRGGLAFACDLDGKISQVIRDDMGLMLERFVGSPLSLLVDRSGMGKCLSFLMEVKTRGAAFDWELPIPVYGKIIILNFSGVASSETFFMAAARTISELDQVLEDLIEKGNEQFKILRIAIKARLDLDNFMADRDSTAFDQLGRLNNEFANLQRELFKKNAELKRLNEQMERAREERIEMERKLLHAEKVESLAVMAGGIAHDFNNLLMGVLGNLDLALDDLPHGSSARRFIEKAVTAADRSAELSRQMLVYTGATLYMPEPFSLGELLSRDTGMLHGAAPEQVTLNADNPAGLPLIRGNQDQVQRLVHNILINAYEAIGDGRGEVWISAGVLDCDEAYLSRSRLQEKPGPGRFVFLEISDTGCGMDGETLNRLFDPFFTTKFTGRGLGMAEVMGIVRGHRGAILVESATGKGTTVRVLFPEWSGTQDGDAELNEIEERYAHLIGESGRTEKE